MNIYKYFKIEKNILRMPELKRLFYSLKMNFLSATKIRKNILLPIPLQEIKNQIFGIVTLRPISNPNFLVLIILMNISLKQISFKHSG